MYFEAWGCDSIVTVPACHAHGPGLPPQHRIIQEAGSLRKALRELKQNDQEFKVILCHIIKACLKYRGPVSKLK